MLCCSSWCSPWPTAACIWLEPGGRSTHLTDSAVWGNHLCWYRSAIPFVKCTWLSWCTHILGFPLRSSSDRLHRASCHDRGTTRNDFQSACTHSSWRICCSVCRLSEDLPIYLRCYLLPWTCESVSLLSWIHPLLWCRPLLLGLLLWRRPNPLCNWGRKSSASIAAEDRFSTGCWRLGCFWWSSLCLQSFASWYLSQPWPILTCSRSKSGISSNIWLCTFCFYHRLMPEHQMSLQVQSCQHRWSPCQWAQWDLPRHLQSRCCTCQDACLIQNICQMNPRLHHS